VSIVRTDTCMYLYGKHSPFAAGYVLEGFEGVGWNQTRIGDHQGPAHAEHGEFARQFPQDARAAFDSCWKRKMCSHIMFVCG